MKYVYGQKQKDNHDWLVIILLYLLIIFMLASTYFAVKSYILNAQAERCRNTGRL